MRQTGLAYPVVVKPDIGCNGTGVCLVDNRADLARYLAAFPRLTRFMLQALIPYEAEAGVFYIRRPGDKTGTITSVTLKSSPVVVGDGRSNLRQLIMAEPRCAQVVITSLESTAPTANTFGSAAGYAMPSWLIGPETWSLEFPLAATTKMPSSCSV